MHTDWNIPSELLAEIRQWEIQEGLASAGRRREIRHLAPSGQSSESFEGMSYYRDEEGEVRWKGRRTGQHDCPTEATEIN